MSVEEITPVAQDYLKVIWSATEWGGPAIGTKELALRFGTTAANVSETVKRLATQQLVEHQPYKPVVLTPRGTELALAMVRRHRLVESFLVETLGYDWDEVHDEAERLEHAVSDTMIDRIDRLLGHPAADPHGDPIPAADGTVTRPAGTVNLSEAAPGAFTVVRISDADPACLGRLLAVEVLPGAEILVPHDASTKGQGALSPLGTHLEHDDVSSVWVSPRVEESAAT
ncbi:transcriptional regulator [Humibacillus sp. DSM 29435]|uniref:metal-dependent transcriptional regulator n=1 Tax=Humibacillus sp. DSM 29435 TaxID=1869167 RepID=UPI000871F868|nr:metal-dependent transcriptional regulator [Humibacillus sp. DSM 29435]OFE17264.1 transcriptional regulator [Humibacillus sp. DSM 29435]